MTESTSTDKLLVLSHIMDKTLSKLEPDKVSKIKSLNIEWKTDDIDGCRLDVYLPELKIEFHP